MTQLEQLEAKLRDWLDETNRWELPKGFPKKFKHQDGRDFERGAWSAFQFIAGQVRSLKKKKAKT